MRRPLRQLRQYRSFAPRTPGAFATAGNSGTNTITGNSGANTLNGGSGNNSLLGGSGADILFGDSGADQFVFTSLNDSAVSSSGRDVIEDFSRSQGDRMNLSAIDASHILSQPGLLLHRRKSYSGKAGELRYVNKDGHILPLVRQDGLVMMWPARPTACDPMKNVA